MAVLSRSLGYLYIMAPRTACTATGVVLCKEVEGRWLPDADMHDEDGNIVVQRKHSTVDELVEHRLITDEEVRDLFVFTAVRNPFDSLASLWVKKTTSYRPLLDDPDSFVNRLPGFADDMEWMLDHTFSEWIEREYGHRDDRHAAHLYNQFLHRADFVMKFENLQEDFERALARVGVEDPPEIPLLNVTEARRDDYRQYYSPTARDIVARVFRWDLDRFDYAF